ncbi:uncharacterized protein [Heliangelus exortis]|uniref:uncharacterized protein isoform X4 n=1 Tax=Heliangelus exortis TaxID=472823 RepID=UPI003A95BEB5
MEPVPTIPPLPPPAMPTLATPPSLGGSKPSRAGNRGGPGVQITPSSVQPEDMSLVLSSGIWFEEPVVTGSMTTDTAAQRSPLESPVLGPARRSHSAGTEQEESKALLVGSFLGGMGDLVLERPPAVWTPALCSALLPWHSQVWLGTHHLLTWHHQAQIHPHPSTEQRDMPEEGSAG